MGELRRSDLICSPRRPGTTGNGFAVWQGNDGTYPMVYEQVARAIAA